MSVEDKNKIDAISTNKENQVVLTISDHLEWDDSNEHLIILQDKVNSYLDFLESGQIDESYPSAAGKKIMIQIVFKFLPNKKGEVFIGKLEAIIKGNGYDFNFYQLAE